MFKVRTEHDEYEVEFSHNPPSSEHIQMWKKGKISEEDFRNKFGTKCTIHNLTTNVVVIEWWTFLNPRDQYDRNKGRKIALTGALKDIFYDRETRQLFWRKYYEARGKKW